MSSCLMRCNLLRASLIDAVSSIFNVSSTKYNRLINSKIAIIFVSL
jgi:hypothetical protein